MVISDRHCDGPASSTVPVTSSAQGEVSESLAPSPTESVGCHPHGDHWHCSGPASTSATPTSSAVDDDHDEHGEGTGSLAPSPTESVGCHSHGDHWHCDGPVVASNTSTPVLTPTQPAATAAAGKLEMGSIVLVGGLLAAAGMGV